MAHGETHGESNSANSKIKDIRQHCFITLTQLQDAQNPNADPNRSHENLHDMSTAREVSEGIKSRIPAKHRADAVLAVEYFIGASPEYFKTIDDPKGEKYFALARKWLVERHGAENVISTSVHLDETSPHLIAYVVPLDEKGTLTQSNSWAGNRFYLACKQIFT